MEKYNTTYTQTKTSIWTPDERETERERVQAMHSITTHTYKEI